MKQENKFKKDLTDAIRAKYGAKAYIQLNHGSMYSSGLPDFECCLDGSTVWVELKYAENQFDWAKEPTALQFHTLSRINSAGGLCGVIVLFGDCQAVDIVPFPLLALRRKHGKVTAGEFASVQIATLIDDPAMIWEVFRKSS